MNNSRTPHALLDVPSLLDEQTPTSTPLMSDFIFDLPVRNRSRSGAHLVGVLKGEGIGPDVIDICLNLLQVLQDAGRAEFALEFGGTIGAKAKADGGNPLPEDVVGFCRSIFERGGAILNGPGGDRYVYDLRVRFDLFCKLSPLQVAPELVNAGRMKPRYVQNVDILLVRENVSGFYQGQWSEAMTPNEGIRAEQNCAYTEQQVCRIVQVAARIAATRHGKLAVILKDGGVPTISKLWHQCAEPIAAGVGVEYSPLNVDHAAYRLIQHAHEFDVIVAPNLFGDVLGDLGSVLIGSRGLSFSGNFAANGAGVYQTNHGSGYDLVGKDMANPVGQIHSLAMMLRQSFGLVEEADLVEEAAAQVWRRGWRTFDIAEEGCQIIGTREMGERITGVLRELVAAA